MRGCYKLSSSSHLVHTRISFLSLTHARCPQYLQHFLLNNESCTIFFVGTLGGNCIMVALENYVMWCLIKGAYIKSRSRWLRCLRRRSAAARLLRSWVRIPPGAWMFVCFDCCVLSGRGLCDELITRPEESYRLCCVVVGAPYIYDISHLRVKV